MAYWHRSEMARRVVLIGIATLAVVLAAACGDNSSERAQPLAVPDALVTSSGELSVEGFVVFDGAELRLCEALAESFPPQCGGAFLVVQGIDVVEVQGTTEAQGVVWTDSVVVLTGTLEEGVLRLSDSRTAEAGIELIARVEVASTAANFGLQPGDPIPGAPVELRSSSMTLDDAPLLEEQTDETGEAALAAAAPNGYMIFATAATEDPLCVWAAGPTEVVVSTPGEVVVVEAFLVCE